jgi:hypothetical protein
MKTTFKSLLAIVSFLFLSAFSLNAQTLKEAWTLYNKNKNQEAKLAFEACAKDLSSISLVFTMLLKILSLTSMRFGGQVL